MLASIAHHPTGQDLWCLVCGQQAQDIDHVQNRGMGGSKERDVPENKAPLCRECHDLKTMGRIETQVYTYGRGDKYQYQWRRQTEGAPWIAVRVEVSPRYKCLVKADPLSAAAEAGTTANPLPAEAEPLVHAGSSAAAPSAGNDGVEGRVVPAQESAPSAPSLTHGQRVEIAQEDSFMLDTHAAYNETSLVLNEGLSYEEWEAEGHVLSQMTRCLAWWWGDWLNYGETVYGEEYAQAIGLTGKDYSTINHWKWTADRIEFIRRRINLSWSHHYEVAALEPRQQDEWLLRTEKEKWGHKTLRVKLLEAGLTKPRQKALSPPKEPTDVFEILTCPSCGYKGERPEFRLKGEPDGDE